MRAYSHRYVLVAMVAAGVLLTQYAPVSILEGASPRCFTAVTFENSVRRVKGGIDEECGPGHSPPWGNWGVDSNYGRRRDGYQWSGWKRKSSWLQWNSCTQGRWAPPNPEYYNDAGHTKQKAAPDDTNSYAARYQRGPRNRTCDSLYGNSYTYRNQYTRLYELDKGLIFGGDDYITTLHYGTIRVPITCSNDWDCRGASSWRSRENSKVSARVRIRIRTWRVWR